VSGLSEASREQDNSGFFPDHIFSFFDGENFHSARFTATADLGGEAIHTMQDITHYHLQRYTINSFVVHVVSRSRGLKVCHALDIASAQNSQT
jgi:hypothetical protein